MIMFRILGGSSLLWFVAVADSRLRPIQLAVTTLRAVIVIAGVLGTLGARVGLI